MTENPIIETGNEPGLKSLDLRDSYDSSDPAQDIATEFLIPVLENAETYDRLSGYFNSGMIAAASRGIASFVLRGKKMRIIASPQFSVEDLEAIEAGVNEVEKLKRVETALQQGLENLDGVADQFEKDHVAAFCWMLNTGQLEVRIAIPNQKANRAPLFHSKVGFVTDRFGDSLSFSGSINETSAGWTVNVEEFKVFTSWDNDKDAARSADDRSRFERFWNRPSESGVELFPLPDAVSKRLLKSAPREESLIRLYNERYAKKLEEQPARFERLRDYQREAVEAWETHGRRGLLVMATGTGKTKTAAAAIERAIEAEDRLVVVVTAPQQHIALQWANELGDMKPITSWGTPKWRQALRQAVAELTIGYRENIAAILVQQSAAKVETLEIWKAAEEAGVKVLFVGDEAHGLGASQMRNALVESFDWRLGLSATPDRYFDDEGKSLLTSYFENVSYEFPIEKALTWIDPVTGNTPLCQYRYYPYFFQLTEDELEEYEKLTLQAIREGGRPGQFGDGNDRLAMILIKRANIVKKSAGKMPLFRKALVDHGPVRQSIVYCQDSDQLKIAADVLSTLNYKSRKFTGEEGTKADPNFKGLSEREWILQDLASGAVDALVSMRCLDEGVDVPSAEMGFFLASSGNPKEFIQRRGRILRPAPGKKSASIIDFICVPPVNEFNDDEAKSLERSIFAREIDRLISLSSSAINSLDVTMELDRVRSSVL